MARVAVIPGNGCGAIRDSNWYGWLEEQLKRSSVAKCAMDDMPDPLYAKRSIWLPFMEKTLRCNAETIVVGHSSGAVAALRYAETHRVRGIILVSAYLSDLGDDLEAASGYFDGDWRWKDITSNTDFIVQFASRDDHLVPFAEQMKVADKLKAHRAVDMRIFGDRNHFMQFEFPELFDTIRELVK